MVVKVSECLVRLPYVTLDVIIQFRGSTGKCPKVGVGNLFIGSGTEVFHPLGVEDSLDVDYTVFFEGGNLSFR